MVDCLLGLLDLPSAHISTHLHFDVALMNLSFLFLFAFCTVSYSQLFLTKASSQKVKNYSDTVLFYLSGEEILQALENGVSQWPKLEGRFPQVCEMKKIVVVT